MTRRERADPELIALYVERKGIRLQLLETHDTIDGGEDDLPRVLHIDLSERAIRKRAGLWPDLDYVNAQIRKFG